MSAFKLFAQVEDGQKTEFDEAIQSSVEEYKKYAGKWTPKSHWLLVTGIICMALGGLTSVESAYCALNPSSEGT